ncbi:hypothetical protein [Henriciella sp.]|uniref:hypothetical protein n=1 Tax=Henriciella sp. TaxID=1968823 RepID=UPI0026156BDD|nr:hypothetical protein [Henriciella sp.]
MSERTDKAELEGLVERLREAEEGTYELDRDIGLALGEWRYLPDDYELNIQFPGSRFMEADDTIFNDSPASIGGPAYTQSLDAALALVEEKLPGWAVANLAQQDDRTWWAELRRGQLTSYTGVAAAMTAPTPALALLIALLTALTQGDSHDG